jgi:hypothetical protein
VDAWFRKMGSQSAERACVCGELESIRHILDHCVLREDIRNILRHSFASLEEKIQSSGSRKPFWDTPSQLVGGLSELSVPRHPW